MPKLTRHNSFSELKSVPNPGGKAVPINERAHLELEALMNRLKAALNKKKPDKHGKQSGG